MNSELFIGILRLELDQSLDLDSKPSIILLEPFASFFDIVDFLVLALYLLILGQARDNQLFWGLGFVVLLTG